MRCYAWDFLDLWNLFPSVSCLLLSYLLFMICRFTKMASAVSCIWYNAAACGTYCKQLGSILLQQFNGYWSLSCHHCPSIPGKVIHLQLWSGFSSVVTFMYASKQFRSFCYLYYAYVEACVDNGLICFNLLLLPVHVGVQSCFCVYVGPYGPITLNFQLLG